MNCTIGCRPNSTCKSFDPEYRHQALALANQPVQCQARQITSGSPLWRDLTKVISNLYYKTQDCHVPAGNRTCGGRQSGKHSSKELFEQLTNSFYKSSGQRQNICQAVVFGSTIRVHIRHSRHRSRYKYTQNTAYCRDFGFCCSAKSAPKAQGRESSARPAFREAGVLAT
jgi:hypothetical protein